MEVIDVKQDILGVKLSYESYQDTHNHVLKVVRIHEGSPASKALYAGNHKLGLQINTDFIVGA